MKLWLRSLFFALSVVLLFSAVPGESFVPLDLSWEESPALRCEPLEVDLSATAAEKSGEGILLTPQGVSLRDTVSSATMEFEVVDLPIEDPEPFLALGVRVDGSSLEGVSLEYRSSTASSEDGGGWTPLSFGCGSPDSGQKAGLVFVDKETRSLRIRLRLERLNDGLAPEVQGLQVSFISPGATPNAVLDQLSRKATLPSYVSRAGWGCAEGQRSDLLDPKWTPQTTTVTHLVVHHTVTGNSASDWPAVVRSIWADHKYTRDGGWGDVGYNWLIDPNGVIYQGRSWWIGGNDSLKEIQGAHFSCRNTGTMGVALLGTFTSTNPTPSARNALANLLAWKCEQRGITCS